MDEILDYVKGWGHNIDCVYNDNDEGISHIYWEFEDRYFCAIEPHGGNNFHYMLRINDKATFDRWGDADLEIYAKDPQEIISYLIENI